MLLYGKKCSTIFFSILQLRMNANDKMRINCCCIKASHAYLNFNIRTQANKRFISHFNFEDNQYLWNTVAYHSLVAYCHVLENSGIHNCACNALCTWIIHVGIYFWFVYRDGCTMYEAMNFGDDRNIPLSTTLILLRYKIQKHDLIGLGYVYSNQLLRY